MSLNNVKKRNTNKLMKVEKILHGDRTKFQREHCLGLCSRQTMTSNLRS